MKKILLIFSVVFLCSTLCIAQKTISKTDFEHLVDYTNCKYVMAFIKKNDEYKTSYFQTYQKNIEPKLQAVSLDKLEDVLSFADLYKLLNGNIPSQKLAEKINERKIKYNDYQDDNSLISSLSTTRWISTDLSQTATTIQNSKPAKYRPADKKTKNSNPVSEAVDDKTQTSLTSTHVEELQAKLNLLQQQYYDLKNDTKLIEYQKSVNNFRFFVIIVLVFIVGFLVFTFFFF